MLVALLLGDKLKSDKIEFGLNLNPTFSTISGLDGDTKPGLGLGLYFNFKLNDNLYFHPEFSPKSVFGIKGLAPYATGNAHVDGIY
ncbi:hypothetical protein [Niabella ginsengisoli]|uniref:Outer membrane protein beta-barrel domain-containing protein n=1 Tax=Niabella ginsengisoli TaxID=522298 RepID=A0ABS9SLY5_9BACT|nr:hypothetical protein [Niabella ginsengisoli]MCH5599306.1 hypothetical protein [Niabella ginsengisoli]